MINYSAYWQAQHKKLCGTVTNTQKVLKRPKIAVQIVHGNGLQFPSIIEQENSAP